MPRKIINVLGSTINLDGLKEINSGGEGTIYRIDDDWVLKIFSEPEKQQEKIEKLTKSFMRDESPWHKIKNFATVPEYPVKNSANQVIGYLMKNCQGWNELTELYTKNSSISLKIILLAFKRLHGALRNIHEQGFVIGDLNSSNVLISTFGDNMQIRVIDTDSWGISRPDLGFSWGPSALNPEVIHPERLIAQEQGKPLPSFSPKHDWWVFAYLMTKCLTKCDPFEQGAAIFWDLGAEARRQVGLTAMHSGISLGSVKNHARHLCIGVTLKHFLKRWLSCSEEGVFPISLIDDTRQEIINCPQCSEEVNERLTLCPYCANLL